MRTSGWLLPVAALLLFVLSVLWPMFAGAEALITIAPSSFMEHALPNVLRTTVLWSVAIAAASMLLGWVPGQWLGSAMARGATGGRRATSAAIIAALFLLPICIPAYVVFWAWWEAWPPDSALYAWMVEHRNASWLGFSPMQWFRGATLFMGLVSWSWPIAAWCVAASASAAPRERDDRLRLDGAPSHTRTLDRLRRDGRHLLLGGFIVAVLTFNNTTCFDLAQIFSYGNELRAMAALGAQPGDVLHAALPAMLVTIAAVSTLWLMLARRPVEQVRSGPRVALALRTAACIILAISVGGPVVLLSRSWSRLFEAGGTKRQIEQFLAYYGEGLRNTIVLALVCGAVSIVLALGLSMLWEDRRRWVRIAADVQAIGWLIMAAMPAHAVAALFQHAFNRPMLDDAIYRTPMILGLAFLARLGIVAVLLGRWRAALEPRLLRETRMIDGAFTLPAWLRTVWPSAAAAAVAAFAITAVLAIAEIPMVASLQPPGFDMIAGSVLNAMHYQRAETALLAIAVFLGCALLGVVLIALSRIALRSRAAARAAANVLLIATAVIALHGCGDIDAEDPPPLDVEFTFGSPGDALGQFNYPRGIAIDQSTGDVFVVDKTARIQRFSPDGKPLHEWHMPARENGKPTGLNVSPDRLVFVADTHYYRVIAYDAEGNEQLRFGEYGEGPGQFIYPTDAEFGADGTIYVAEYGGNDRVQAFSPEGEYLFEFGGFGSDVGKFNRPQSMHFNYDRSELFIADGCNHRIVVVDPKGAVLRTFGQLGRLPGEFSYPYDVTVLEDRTILVSEFGNHRVQHLTPDGRCLGLFGRLGRGEGEVQYPWGVDVSGDRVFVLDSGNNRVQVIDVP